MPSLDPIPTTLSDHLRHLGLGHTAAELNDLIARATQKRWSPVVLLEQLAQGELAARLSHASSAGCMMRGSAASSRWPISNGRGRPSSIARPSSGSSRSTFSRNAKT
jgi:hypothetical protein